MGFMDMSSHVPCSEFNLESLSDKELLAVDVLLAAVKYVGLPMVSGE